MPPRPVRCPHCGLADVHPQPVTIVRIHALTVTLWARICPLCRRNADS